MTGDKSANDVGEAALLFLLTVLLSFPGQCRVKPSLDSFVDRQESGGWTFLIWSLRIDGTWRPDITQSYRDQKGRHNRNTRTQIGTIGKLRRFSFRNDYHTITTGHLVSIYSFASDSNFT